MRTKLWTLGLLLVAGCSDPVTTEDVLGTYQATEFTVTLNSVPHDLLAGGATVTLVLESGGTTSGAFHLPVTAGVNVTEINDDLTGTFAIHNGVVSLTQQADSYIKDFLFVAAGGQLRASQVIQSATLTGNLRLVLTRQ
jgi:hypothetical protein